MKIESDFKHKGLRCIVVAQEMGHRCGYVEVKKDNLLYNLSYDSRSEYLKRALKKRLSQPIGENPSFSILISCLSGKIEPSPSTVFSVHGGLTYSGHGKKGYPIKSNGWWFGFDASHCDDARDITIMDDKHKELYRTIDLKYPIRGIVRSKEYMENECRQLVEQLKLFKRKDK